MNITLIRWDFFRDLRPIYKVQPITKIEATKEKPRKSHPIVVGMTIDVYA